MLSVRPSPVQIPQNTTTKLRKLGRALSRDEEIFTKGYCNLGHEKLNRVELNKELPCFRSSLSLLLHNCANPINTIINALSLCHIVFQLNYSFMTLCVVYQCCVTGESN